MQTFNIREYEENDLPQLLEMARTYAESKGMVFAPGSMADYFRKLYSGGMIFVAYEDDKVLGGMGILLSDNPFTGNRVMLQSDLFVLEDYRNKGIAKALQNRAAAFSNELGIEELTWV